MARKKHRPPAVLPPNRPNGTQQVIRTEAFTGPLPPPHLLEQYNTAVPNGAERILAMAERQAAHRQEIEKIAVTSNARRETCGQICGLVVALAAIAGGVVLTLYDKQAAGLAAIITPLAGLVVAFLYGKRIQRTELERKRFV